MAIGERFGRLTVISGDWMPPGMVNHGNLRCRVRCDCGNEKDVYRNHLRAGLTRSCGCFNSEVASIRGFKHGETETPEYDSWCAMLGRCKNEASPAFPDYGGRGIYVCKEWRDFRNFMIDMGKKPSPEHSIDRINNDLGYSPENCRWATRAQQSRNTRGNVRVLVNGQSQIITDALTALRIPKTTFYRCVRRRKITHQQALSVLSPGAA